MDVRCSNSCTRAGLTALLLSAIAISMLQPLTQGRALIALGKYISSRFNLESYLNELDVDPCWKQFKAKSPNHDPEKSNLSLPLKYECESGPTSFLVPSTAFSLFASSWQSNVFAQDAPPAPPTNIKALQSIFLIYEIANTLTELGDGKLLALARSYSFRYDNSIYKWSDFRYRLIAQNKHKGDIPIYIKTKDYGEYYVGTYERDELINYLTLENIRELSKYEMPNMSEVEGLSNKSGRFNLPWNMVSLDASSAAIFVEFALLFALIYFWLYQREAKISPYFPLGGTLFAVFRRTNVSRVVFKILVAIPPIAAWLLAMRSLYLTKLNVVLAVFILLFSVLIVREDVIDQRPITSGES